MLTPIALVRFHLKLKQYNEIISRFITDTSNRYGIMLSYTSFTTEDVPLWTQTFNIATKNTNAKKVLKMIRKTMLNSAIGTHMEIDQKHNT